MTPLLITLLIAHQAAIAAGPSPHAALTSALASIKGDVTIDASYSAPVTLSAPLLADMIARVLPFVAKSGERISITGALVRVEGDGRAPGVLTETCPGALESIYIVMPTRVVK